MSAPPSAGIAVVSGGLEIAAERLGEGGENPLLCIMGMSGTRAHWGEEFTAALASGRELIRLDNRGTGSSGRVEEEFSIADMAADAVAVLDAAEIERADVLGVSMGGMIAQRFTLDYPERVGRLVLGCTFAGGPSGQLTPAETATRLQQGWSSGDVDEALRAAWEVNVSAEFAEDEREFERFRELAIGNRVAMAVIGKQMAAIGEHNVADRLGEIEAETLVIHGSEDRMLPAENATAISEAIGDSRTEILDGVGHMFWLERPTQSAEKIAEFLG